MKAISSLYGILCVALVAEAKPFAAFPSVPQPGGTKHLRPVLEKRQTDPGQPVPGEPIDSKGRGSVLSGGTNRALDLQNPDNLGAQVTDAGTVVNLKWAFSDSHTRLLNGGWVREQVVTDLPASEDISAAQQHLKKGATREFHWHRVAEWGYVYAGEVLISAVDEHGRNQIEKLGVGDIWYFPKGQAHAISGLADENEYLLAFDDGNFDAQGTTFNLDDWLAHTPAYIVARNFGVNETFFKNLPATDPYIVPSNDTLSTAQVSSPYGQLRGSSSFVYRLSQKPKPSVPGGGGTLAVIDSHNFPAAKTIAAAIVTLKPGALRELHWHPNAEEWLYFLSGHARATVFLGPSAARTFDFQAGDTAVFPDNSGHYVENISKNETLQWIELYKSDHVAEISLTQWLAVSPPDTVAKTLNVSVEWVKQLKKEKQIILA